jgi:hypothetical protein
MALDRKALAGSLESLFADMPGSLGEAASRWAKAYHSYAKEAMAGVCTPSGLNRAALTAVLAGSTNFYTSLASGIQAYWQAAVWAGPGFTGVTASAGGLRPLLKTLGAELIALKKASPSKLAAELASVLHTYTRTVVVTTTNVSSGATAPATLR